MVDRWITINQLSERLTISVPAIRNWIRRGTMPPSCYVQVGGAYRFDYDAIIETFRGRAANRPPSDTSRKPEQLELDFGEEHRVIRKPIPIYPIED